MAEVVKLVTAGADCGDEGANCDSSKVSAESAGPAAESESICSAPMVGD